MRQEPVELASTSNFQQGRTSSRSMSALGQKRTLRGTFQLRLLSGVEVADHELEGSAQQHGALPIGPALRRRVLEASTIQEDRRPASQMAES